MVYKPKKWLTYFRFICLVCVCILINGMTIKYEKQSIRAMNENLSKNIEKKLVLNEEEPIANLEEEQLNVQEAILNSKYISIPEKGFTVTTDNRKYELSYSDFVLFAAVIASEANRSSIDDTLAVTSVILNRADTRQMTPIEVITAPGQFSGYWGNYYLKYIDETGTLKNLNQEFIDTIHEAINGTRNNTYKSFRSWGTTSYGDNFIVEGGNRYN